jgi:hypothetical protein
MAERELRSLIGRTVVLSAAGSGDKYAFVVDAATPSVTVLHPDDVEARRFAATLPSGAVIRIGAPVSDGILVAEARVEHWSPTVRVLTLSNPPSLQHIQRRAVFRVPISYGIRVGVARGGRMMFATGETIDLSEAGLAATVKGMLVRPGEPVAASINLQGGSITVVARVVVPGDGGRQPIRMRIEQIASADFAQLTAELRQAEIRRVRTAAAAIRG